MNEFTSLREESSYEVGDSDQNFLMSLDTVSRWEGQVGSVPSDANKTQKFLAAGNLLSLELQTDKPAICSDSIPDHLGALYQGDCLQILPQLGAGSVDLILCDLPYGTTQNRWDSVIDLERLWAEYRRVLKPGGIVVLTSQGVFTAKLILSNEEWFKYKIVWEKSKSTNFLNAKKQPLRKHEDICVFYRKPTTYNPQMKVGKPYDKGVRKDQLSGSYGDFLPAHVKSNGGRYPSDVVYFKTAESEAERQVWHPTQKPVELGRYLVRTYSNEGDVVLDNAFGSGSFLVAAALEGRQFIGIERNKETHLFKGERIDYVALAAERLRRVGVKRVKIRSQ